MYFRNFEKGFYDLAGNGNQKIVTDLMTRVKVRAKVLDEISLYDKYDVPSGERPEDTSFKHFGSSQYHWVVLLTNNITDVYYDWPMSEQDFETFITYVLVCYDDTDMTKKEAIKYTKIYNKLFPNLWGGGDSLDREKVYELFLMGRADALAKKHNEEGVA